MSDLILFWHRRDLRLTDNLGLTAASQKSSKIVGIFCFDPDILQRDDLAPARVVYLIDSLQELQANYRQLGSDLLIFQANPTQLIPSLAVSLKAKSVLWNLDVEPYSQTRDEQIKLALQAQGIITETCWDQLLHSPGSIVTQSDKVYTVYTPFWNNLSKKPKAAPTPPLKALQGLSDHQLTIVKELNAIALPTAKDLGFVWHNPLPLLPGEKAAQSQLQYFCDRVLSKYKQERDFPAIEGTSLLSAALKFGTIGIRTLWQAADEMYKYANSDEARESIITWQKELVWREFYQHCLYLIPELANSAYRQEFQDFPWDNNEEYFQAWCEGKTGYPIVDAAMRQLNETGWMHNRCRMIVASFLTKDLIINWQWGEKYFMQKLIDGDLASNNGGWQWSASTGMDAQPLRIFNPASQTQRYDSEAEYIRKWLPELSSIETEYLVTGKIPSLDCHSCGYPLPIVEHNQQQKEFKNRYNLQKSLYKS